MEQERGKKEGAMAFSSSKRSSSSVIGNQMLMSSDKSQKHKFALGALGFPRACVAGRCANQTKEMLGTAARVKQQVPELERRVQSE